MPDSLERSRKTVLLIGLYDDDDGPAGSFEGLVPAPIDLLLRFEKVMAAVVLNSNSGQTKAEVGRWRAGVPRTKFYLQLRFTKTGVQHGQSKECLRRRVRPYPHKVQCLPGADNALKIWMSADQSP